MPQPSLVVEDLAVRRGGRRVLQGLSFGLAAGELLALSGRNGSGKTTLLRALALLAPCDAGGIRWQGENVVADRDAWRGRLAWLGHSDGLKGDLTLGENLVSAETLRGGAVPSSLQVSGALAAFGLGPLVDRPARILSAGQRRRAGLARVVASDAVVWLLDEPLNGLDEPARNSLHAALNRHLGTGGLVVAATHMAFDIADARSLELVA